MVSDDRRCTAKSKQSGERCKRPAAVGKQVCHMHGAKAGPPKGNLNGMVAVSHVAGIFGANEAGMMSVRMLRLFASTLHRNAKNETWAVKAKIQDQAHTLFAKVAGGELNHGQVKAELDILLDRKPRAPKPKPSPARRVMTALGKLSNEQQLELYKALQRKFAGHVVQQQQPERHDMSIPIAEAPGQQQAAARRPTFVDRLTGKAG